jgi:hypothetical protein
MTSKAELLSFVEQYEVNYKMEQEGAMQAFLQNTLDLAFRMAKKGLQSVYSQPSFCSLPSNMVKPIFQANFVGCEFVWHERTAIDNDVNYIKGVEVKW